MFSRGLSGPQVRAGHLPGLEAVPSAGGGARCPGPRTPLKGAGLRGAVLQGAGPGSANTTAAQKLSGHSGATRFTVHLRFYLWSRPHILEGTLVPFVSRQ